MLTLAILLALQQIPTFKEQVVDPALGTGYAVTIADINGDGKPDIIVVTEEPDQVVWFENPTWKKHPIVGKEIRLPVCVQAMDVDGDGKTELLLGADWQPSNSKTGGSVWLLQRPADLDQPWTPIKLDEEPLMHRFRIVNGQFACKTLKGRDSAAGDGNPALLFLLKKPADPFKDKWTREVVQNDVHITHNFWPVDLDGDGKQEILLAGLEGVFVFKQGEGKWDRTKIGDGDPVKKGAGEIKLGRLPGGKRYIATVEPWHGHSAAVYIEPDKAGEPWRRQVLVENHKGGHALWAADFTGTKVDSLVVGFRGFPESKDPNDSIVYVFHPSDAKGETWEKKVLDHKGLGSEDVICADLDGDGKIDIVGVGRSTKNVKIYWNGK
ncbi:MAG TPA: VCBS repeat-containing protein [Planctomycetota bacterium]|nr:VCBS repeat-containing protein [Planctomycetota bacterium]